MNICILGRQGKLALAELEQCFGAERVQPIGDEYALVDAAINIDHLGGTVKVAKLLTTLDTTNPQKVFDYCRKQLPKYASEYPEGKVQLGVSLYGLDMPLAKVNANVLSLKKAVKQTGRSVRAVPNTTAALSSAQTYHNHMAGPMGMELVFVRYGKQTLLGQITGVQNIDAYAARDQAGPKTDAFVGMLPPKLAQMMINMSGITNTAQISEPFFKKTKSEVQPDTLLPGAKSVSAQNGLLEKMVAEDGQNPTEAQPEAASENSVGEKAKDLRILDPFCGTGVVLQEAALLGFDVYGTDLSEKMVDYSGVNLKWLVEKFDLNTYVDIHHGDAIETSWQPPIDAVVAETYLGQPFSAPPAPDKLSKVRRICNEIISRFLLNLAPQIGSNTVLCLAVPAWRSDSGRVTHLPLVTELEKLGYARVSLVHAASSELLYYREDQVVARELLILRKIK